MFAHGKIRNAVANTEHAAGALDAKHFRVRGFRPRHALPNADIHEIHTCHADLNDNVSGRCHRLWALDEFHNVAIAHAVHDHSFHSQFLS
ncbi:hypothetical protein D9M68_962270 [compost metagenome]